MIPAKNRERKCSTCKHYQPSPLWRKGWCRNPLLYDRNTNHLVEADSLACNRTFIDYWEPIDGPAQISPTASAGHRPKPRIAPSVPLEQVDKKGNRKIVTGNTPAMGMTSVPPKQVITLTATPKPSPFASLVDDDDLLDDDELGADDPKATLQIEQVAPPEQLNKQTAKQRIQQGRAQKGKAGVMPVLTRPLPFVRAPLWMALALLLVLAAVGGGYYLTRLKSTPSVPVVVSQASVTVPVASPTGFGDPTFTVPPKPTVPATVVPTVPPNVIAPGAYVQVTSTSGLSVRDAPTTKGKKLLVLANGSKAHITGPSQTADGFTWWPIDRFDPANPERAGWCAEQFLTPATAP